MLAHLFRATPQQTLAGENLVKKPVGRTDGRQLENHTNQGHQRYETRNASATNSIRQLWRGEGPHLFRPQAWMYRLEMTSVSGLSR